MDEIRWIYLILSVSGDLKPESFSVFIRLEKEKCPQHCLRHQCVSAGSSVSSQVILSAAGAKEPKSTTQSVRSHTLNSRDALRAIICRVAFQIAAEMQSTVSVSVASLHWAGFETVHSTDSCVSPPFLTIIMTAATVYFAEKKKRRFIGCDLFWDMQRCRNKGWNLWCHA